MSKKVFGIDLGTTNSAIAVYENGVARILKNLEGNDITPSVVFFTGVSPTGVDEILVGEQAKNAAATCPEYVAQFTKRLMGRSGPAYNLRAPSGKEYTPEMISALILRKVCQDAEEFAQAGVVEDVVITVPAYFDDARRTATKHAGKIAGSDKIWACGIRLNDDKRFDASNWTGDNILGFALMEVREKLKETDK